MAQNVGELYNAWGESIGEMGRSGSFVSVYLKSKWVIFVVADLQITDCPVSLDKMLML